MLGYLRSGSKRTKMIWWIVTISTVATFLLGFSFFGSMGRDPSLAARQSGSFGLVNGEKITREMWQSALDSERAAYRQRFGSDPVDRDLRAVEQQAWRKLVSTRLLAQEARRSGVSVTDNDVIFRLESDPPAAVLSMPAFQTNGQFDPAKYRAAMMNPNNDWSGIEQDVRDEVPAMKLQKSLLASLKLSQGELEQAMRDRMVRLSAIVVQVPPDTAKFKTTDADLQKAYDTYRSRMATPARTQLEVLSVPIEYSPDEVKTAMDLANSIFGRIQKGEDFTQLARDYSEGPGSDKGGIIDRVISLGELGPLAQPVQAAQPGAVLPPIRQNNAVMLFRVLGPAQDSTARNLPPGSVKLAQIMIKIHPAQESVQKQYERVVALQKRAKAVGLARAATEKGLSTTKTPFFDLDNMPPQLYAAPEAADWGTTHAQGDVSPVYEGTDQFLIAQVAVQHAAGIPTRAEVNDQLQTIAEYEKRIDAAKARADKLAAAVHSGMTLEAAAASVGVNAIPVSFTRSEPDPRLASSPELQGLLWGAKPGQVVGPVRAPAGWLFGRVESVSAPPDSMLANQQLRGQFTTDILTRRQRSFFTGYVEALRGKAKIADTRSVFGGN